MRLFVLFALVASCLQTAESTVRVVVAADGAGDFKTIQMAIDQAPNYSSTQ